jgi:signal transduction histidine kinase
VDETVTILAHDLGNYLAAEVVAVMTTPQWPVTLATQDDETYCEADPERLRQVLANLLSNASKHTPVRNGHHRDGGLCPGCARRLGRDPHP